MKAGKEFPVSTGTVLSLSCNIGYEIKGDETVTCTKNTEFQFSVEPNCGTNDRKGNVVLLLSLAFIA